MRWAHAVLVLLVLGALAVLIIALAGLALGQLALLLELYGGR